MIRNLTILGLALVALLTLGARFASAATFHSETSPTTLTGTQIGVNVFTTDTGAIHCNSAFFEGTTFSNTSSSMTVTPTYSGCFNTGLAVNTTIDHNGCKYTINTSGHAAISGCTNGTKSILMTAPFCNIEITQNSNQTLTSVSFMDVGSTGTTRELYFVVNVNNMSYHEAGFACDNPSGSNTTGGKYQGTIRVTGENPSTKVHHGIWWTA